MAKPMHVASPQAAGPSTSIPSSSTNFHPSQSQGQRRRRSKRTQLAPSSTVLSLLAAVASSTVAEGSPTPPAFLCPSLESAKPTSTRTRARRAPTSNPAPTSSTATLQAPPVVKNIAYKFEQGEDGRWRKTESYTLYGVCLNCGPGLDGQIIRNNVTMPTNNNNLTKHEPPDNLPPGWTPTPRRHSAHTTLILAMSLVLAFFICFFIIGCLFWRKSMRRKNREKDLERRARKRMRRARDQEDELSVEEAKEIQLEKENKQKQRLWARATARWKANARQVARQRRGKRVTSSIHARQSTASLDDRQDTLTTDYSVPVRSPPHSRSSSRRSSSASFHQVPANLNSEPSSPSQHDASIPTIAVSTAEPPTSPPAYHQTHSSKGLYPQDDQTSTSLHSRSRRPSHSSFALSTNEDAPSEPQSPALASAHVATDDKAVLARLAQMASSPPTDQSTSEQQVSVPEWRDEELDDFMALGGVPEDQQTTPPLSSNISPFPPPPSKAQLLAPNFYDYPYAFEEMTSMEPEYGPSAPPFEETPSAPLADENSISLLPSAPPLIDDDDFYMPDSIPSAPPAEAPSSISPNAHAQGETQDSSQEPHMNLDTRGGGEHVESQSTTPSLQEQEGRGDLPVYRP